MAIITISRGSLSGGRAVAECLADQLDWPVVAREILQEAALDLGVAEEAVREKFETAPGLWARLKKERDLYVLAVQTALAERAVEADGNLIYHGLAGQFLLRGVPGVLRVRLVAPLEMRIEALTVEPHRLSREAARQFIDNVDQERRRRVRIMYDADVEDPSFYDLTANLRVMTVDTVCLAIGEAAAEPRYAITDTVRGELADFAAACRARLDTELSEA